MTRTAPTVLVVLMMVLSGCTLLDGSETETAPETPTVSATQTPDATPTQSPTATDAREQVTVLEGSLPSVDETTAFYRVRSLLDRDVRPPTVVIRNLTERKNYRPGVSPLLSSLGFENVSLSPDEPGGLTQATTGRVFLHTGDGSPADVERLLAHEYAHSIQFNSGMLPWLTALDPPRQTSDRIFSKSMIVEGGAVFVGDHYTERYLDVRNESALNAERFESGNASERFFWGRYHYGHRYVDDRIDDPAALASVYQDYPTTTEQVMHNLTSSEAPVASLSINRTDRSSRYNPLATDTQGEFVLRMALETELNRDRAGSAATGWGNDSLASFQGAQNPETFGWVWSIRMDDTGEADELASALQDYAENRSAASDLTFRTDRVDDRTVALTFGEDQFAENVTVADGQGEATVDVTVGSGS